MCSRRIEIGIQNLPVLCYLLLKMFCDRKDSADLDNICAFKANKNFSTVNITTCFSKHKLSPFEGILDALVLRVGELVFVAFMENVVLPSILLSLHSATKHFQREIAKQWDVLESNVY